MKVDADVNDFIPDGSYLKDWFAVLQDNFGSSGTTVNLYWVNDAAVCRCLSERHFVNALTSMLEFRCVLCPVYLRFCWCSSRKLNVPSMAHGVLALDRTACN